MSRISRRDLVGTHSTRTEPQILAVPTLCQVIAEAQKAQRHYAHSVPGFDEPKLIPKPAAAMRTLTLDDTAVRVDRNGKIMVEGTANNAGETISIAESIFRGSRFAQAGGNIEFWPHLDPQFVGKTGIIGTVEQPKAFAVVGPADLELIADDEFGNDTEMTVSSLPLYLADISRANQKSYGVCYRLSRAQQIARGEEQTAAEVLTAIFSGLSKVVDKLAIAAILANTPEAFTLAKAAAAGVRFDQLRGLVGTNGANAHINANGRLVVWPFSPNVQTGGIPGELTPVAAETIVGDFSRALAILGADMTILVNRLTVAGDVTVSAWLSVDAVCPASGLFWTV